jgi:microcystin-dependent protein
MTVYKWSQTASADATADSTINWAEGQSPSSVNDSARAMMAATAKYRDDIAGAIVTGGSSTAYTVSSYQVFDTPAHMANQVIAFTPHTTNGATVTLNVDSLGAKPLRSAPLTELLAGTLIRGTPYLATYNNLDAVWYLQSFYGNPYNIPLGGGLPFFGSTAPNSSFVFPFGQAISRSTYATLFSLLGTAYGVGDGSSTFNLPDLRGRVPAGSDTMGGSGASRLTIASGMNGTGIGATGGAQMQTLLTANLPAYTPAGLVSVSSVAVSYSVRAYASSGATVNTQLSLSSNVGSDAGTLSNVSGSASALFTGTAQGGTSTPIVTVQPTLVCNYIIRIL